MKDEHIYHIKPICHIKPQTIYHINPPENPWASVQRKKGRFVNKNRVPLIKFVNQCRENQCRCDDDDCIEKAINYIETDTICSVETGNPKTICEFSQNHEGFEHIRVQVDSGAVYTVGPKSIGRAFKIKETPASKSGDNFVAANGSVIKNYGERETH